MLRLRQFTGLVILLTAAGCSSDSSTKLSSEVSKNVQPGISLDQTITTMHSRGFRCQPTRPPAKAKVVQCGRQRAHLIVATCVQTVWLYFAPETSMLARVEVIAPVCTGL